MGNLQLENHHHHDWNRNILIYSHSGGHLLTLMNKNRNSFMHRRCCCIITIYSSTPIFKKDNNKNKKHNVGFKPFNYFNCQINTNAGKANSLINHVQFWIEMFKKDFVTLPLKCSPQIRYESIIYIPWLWSSWLSKCKYVCMYVESTR
jgi:hypothetical protein